MLIAALRCPRFPPFDRGLTSLRSTSTTGFTSCALFLDRTEFERIARIVVCRIEPRILIASVRPIRIPVTYHRGPASSEYQLAHFAHSRHYN
ncbi:hypothetical protein ACFWVM_31220 [Nocardia fluminea]|uniref:hypothetical protein n=1 Tax=Nocardia fluminea TaxID=134984 RepID=UPI0036585967